MKKNLKTGNFLVPDNKKDPIVLFIFNQYEDNVDNVIYTLSNNNLSIIYPSGNILDVEVDDKLTTKRIEFLRKFLIIEVDDNTGDISALYEVNK